MKISSLYDAVAQTPAIQLARLSGPHGYRFEGDTVHLNAMFAIVNSAAHERSWALQLWACPAVPASASDLSGHIVTEVTLPPIGELADETEHYEVSAFAMPPAGVADYVMVLVLVSGRAGQFNDVHDFAIYPNRQEFVQPRLSGNVGYRQDGSRVELSVERVENPRVEGNVSGSLSLELWALPAAFTGGHFEGHHLAGVEIAPIDGQYEQYLQPINLDFTAPPSGSWRVMLMLREWTANGFVTRDFTNFATPFVVAAIVEKTPAPTAPPVIAKVAAVPAPAAPPVIAKAQPPVVAKTVVAETPKAVAPVPAPAKGSASAAPKAFAPAEPAKAPVVAKAQGVSVNSARVEELAAVKGLSPKIAEGIVKKRPFSSLDELRNVKGLGEKLLAKVRSSLRL